MLGSCDPMAFVATARPEEARRFYSEVLGLRLLADDDFALVYDLNGTPLRVQKVRDHAPAMHTVLGWVVPDIAAAVAALAGRGVAFQRYDVLEQDAAGVWKSPGGARVAWFKDPDGNTLSLTQFP
jgi:catechol 2,3-dioxygenase-like lactoylglutathione lyase family enzyme